MIDIIEDCNRAEFLLAVNIALKEGWSIHTLCTSLEAYDYEGNFDGFNTLYIAYMEKIKPGSNIYPIIKGYQPIKPDNKQGGIPPGDE